MPSAKKNNTPQFGIAYGMNVHELTAMVQQRLNDGWQLHGQVFEWRIENIIMLNQAMVLPPQQRQQIPKHKIKTK